MRLLTAFEISGEVSAFEGELDANYVHKYETVYGPDLGENGIEDEFEQIEGVNDVSVRNVSSGMPQYEVEIFLDYIETIRQEEYQEKMDQTL